MLALERIACLRMDVRISQILENRQEFLEEAQENKAPTNSKHSQTQPNQTSCFKLWAT